MHAHAAMRRNFYTVRRGREANQAWRGSAVFTKPAHSTTGRRGYFGKCGSTTESPHCQKIEPRSETIFLPWAQLSQRPGPLVGFGALVVTLTSIARIGAIDAAWGEARRTRNPLVRDRPASAILEMRCAAFSCYDLREKFRRGIAMSRSSVSRRACCSRQSA